MADKVINIPRPNIEQMKVSIKGTAPLIFNKFSEKAKQMILDKQLKKAKTGREAKDPQADYQNSYYRNKDGKIAFPATNIKQAIVDSARNVEGLPMTLLRGAVFVLGDEDGFIEVKYEEEGMRQDMVRVGMGSADVRFRGQVKGWSMEFLIKYNASVLSNEQILNLLQYAGFSCGLGEWRPQKNGDYGTFEIA